MGLILTAKPIPNTVTGGRNKLPGPCAPRAARSGGEGGEGGEGVEGGEPEQSVSSAGRFGLMQEVNNRPSCE